MIISLLAVLAKICFKSGSSEALVKLVGEDGILPCRPNGVLSISFPHITIDRKPRELLQELIGDDSRYPIIDFSNGQIIGSQWRESANEAPAVKVQRKR